MYRALLKVQQSVGSIRKDAVNPFHKNRYASLGAILEVLLPILHENGFVLMQPIERDGDTWGVHTWLYWTGDKVSDRIDCGFIPLLECKDPQAQGKAITYNRRYSIQTALGLWAEDDDGESACGRDAHPAGAPPPAKKRYTNTGACAVAPATVVQVQEQQAPAQTKGVDAVIAPIPQLGSVVAPSEPEVKIDAAPFRYDNNAHRKLLTRAVKEAQIPPAKMTPVREFFESGKWVEASLTADINVLIAKIKELAAN